MPGQPFELDFAQVGPAGADVVPRFAAEYWLACSCLVGVVSSAA